VAGRARAPARHSRRQRIPECVDGAQARADHRISDCRLRSRYPAAHFICAQARRPITDHQCAVRDQSGVRDVLLFRLERRRLYRRRNS
jgi:hypothetical protein